MLYKFTCGLLFFVLAFAFSESEKCNSIGNLMPKYKSVNVELKVLSISVIRNEKNRSDCSSHFQVIKEIRPTWKLANLECPTLINPYTNRFDLVRDITQKEVIYIKIFAVHHDLMNGVDDEVMITQQVHKAGLGPPVYCKFKNGFAMGAPVGEMISHLDMKNETIYKSIAETMALLKSIQLKTADKTIRMWKQLHKYISQIPDKYSNATTQKRFEDNIAKKYPNLSSRDNILKECEMLIANLTALNCPIKFCHSDIYPDNIWFDRETNTITVASFATSWYNCEWYDMATHFFEYAGVTNINFDLIPNVQFRHNFIKVYLGTRDGTQEPNNQCKMGTYTDKDVDRMYVQVNKYILASDMFWGCWGLAQAANPQNNFDHMYYSIQRFDYYMSRKDKVLAQPVP